MSTKKSDFIIWERKVEDHAAMLHEVKGFEETNELVRGVPWAAKFPKNVRYTMHPERPQNTVLTDSMLNLDKLLVASDRLKKMLEQSNIQADPGRVSTL